MMYFNVGANLVFLFDFVIMLLHILVMLDKPHHIVLPFRC